MASLDMDSALARLDELARAEYDKDFLSAINGSSDEVALRRMARVAGIELKYPFAIASPITHESATGAKQEWNFNPAMMTPKRRPSKEFKALKQHPSYELAQSIYNELRSQGDFDAKSYDLVGFLERSQSERTWFLAALRAIQPYICEQHTNASDAESPRIRKLWELVAAAAAEIAEHGTLKALGPVCDQLSDLVPFLKHPPEAFLVGFSFILVHYATRGFCKAEIEKEIIQTLQWNKQGWESR